MLVRTGRTRRSSFAVAEQNRQRIVTAAEGKQVVVIVAGIYNGPNNKSLGWCEESVVIRVAVGDYADSLVRDGLVALYDDTPVVDDEVAPALGESLADMAAPPVPPQEPEAPPAIVDPMPWRSFLEAGVTEKVAKVVWESGLQTQDQLIAKWSEAGLAALTALSGVGDASARKLLIWAGLTPEDLA